jgi:type IV pilus biogenesis protein CpaD/CtpE
MDPRFQSFIEAAVQRARAESKLLWADEIAVRIVSSSPLSVNASDIAEQLRHEAVRAGVPVTVTRSHPAGTGASAACAFA